jgi:hypothetical protein
MQILKSISLRLTYKHSCRWAAAHLGNGIAEVTLDALQDAGHVLQARPLAAFPPATFHLPILLLSAGTYLFRPVEPEECISLQEDLR